MPREDVNGPRPARLRESGAPGSFGRTGRSALLGLLALVCLPAVSAEAQPAEDESGNAAEGADVAEDLAYAENAWLFGDYEEVIAVLEPLVFPEPVDGLGLEDGIHIYELLGASQFLHGGPASARPSFHELLRLEPDYDLDPFLYPASVVRFFRDLRDREFREELDEIRAARREQEEPAGVRFVERRVEERSIFVSILPFGIGHFINGERGWGIAYLSGELALGGVSLAMFVTNEAVRGDDGFYDPADIDAVRTRNAIQIGTGIAFVALLVGNMAHGAVIHQGVVQTSYGIMDEPPEDFLQPSNRAPRLRGWLSGDGFLFGVEGGF